MKKRNFVAIPIILVVINLCLSIAGIYVAGSLITSSIKAVTDSCHVEYGIEPIVSGDWFCPDKE